LTLLVFVGAIQGLLQFEGMRRILNKSIWLEGEPIAKSIAGLKEPVYPFVEWTTGGSSDERKVGDVCFRFLDEPESEVWAFVNGVAVKRLTSDDGSVHIRDGDVLELRVSEGNLSVTVSAVSKNVRFPNVGFMKEGSESLTIGKILLE
jgi:hypothetical protein